MLSNPHDLLNLQSNVTYHKMFVTSLNSTKYLAEHLLLVHISTSHISLGNAGHFEVEQGLILHFEHIVPNEQPIQL